METVEGQLVCELTEYHQGYLAMTPVLKRPRGNHGGRMGGGKLKDIIITFDIETTRLTGAYDARFRDIDKKTGMDTGRKEQSVCYLWACYLNHKITVTGRTIQQFSELLKLFDDELEEDERVVIWVHNLSYEFQFLRQIHDFGNDEVFAVKSRKILKCNIGPKFEFRCSYLQSNMSLNEFTRKMQVEHQKLSGEDFDYDAIRFPWTPIPPDKMLYQLHDVWGQAEALEKEMQIDGDTLYTVPLTSTGYVRRDARKALQKDARVWIRSVLPEPDVFRMCTEAFRGGNTHANRYYSGRILTNVKSADRSSSYPDTQVNCQYPIGRWYRLHDPDLEEVLHLINVRKKAVLLRVSITALHLIDVFEGCPYISRDKCRKLENGAFDNGRVLSAEYLETTITDIDLKIILDTYDFADMCVIDCAYSTYGMLPQALRDLDIEYYRRKTELKNVAGQEIYYMKSKNKLNSIYGMTAQRPDKQDILYNGGEFKEDDKPLEELLSDYYDRAFMSYAWATWCTAWARWRLQEGIKLAGHNFVYCDTDSVKYIGDIDWDAYNAERIADSRKSGAYATDPDGVTHYMGVYEQEDTYTTFATLGAKKYAYTFPPNPKKKYYGGTLVTIAGVTKSEGGAELDRGDKRGHGLERFIDVEDGHGFTFDRAGGTDVRYNDEPLGWIEIDGHQLYIGENVVLRPSTYKLGLTAEYEQLIKTGHMALDNWANSCYSE